MGGPGSGGKRPGAGRRVDTPEHVEALAYARKRGELRALLEFNCLPGRTFPDPDKTLNKTWEKVCLRRKTSQYDIDA